METDEVSRQQRALELYEKGAASESTGLMRDAIVYYSRALKVHHDVEKIYRRKVQEEHQAIVALEQLTLEEREENGEGETLALEPCLLLEILTDDILTEIATILSHTDPRAHVALSATCRRLSECCFSSLVYKQICKQVYPDQVYSSTAVQLNKIVRDQEQMVKNWDGHWEAMLNDRPFLKYRGVYIAKVTYISEGDRVYTYYAPVKLVTYFRYMRFYRDGTVMKLTTTDEPSLVVPHFDKENVNSFKGALLGRFTLEMDGQVTITRSAEDYSYVEELKVISLGDRKFHRLAWITSSCIDKDGDRSYFNMKREKPFNFSGVKSYA